jgi:hypothetical protein
VYGSVVLRVLLGTVILRRTGRCCYGLWERLFDRRLKIADGWAVRLKKENAAASDC